MEIGELQEIINRKARTSLKNRMSVITQAIMNDNDIQNIFGSVRCIWADSEGKEQKDDLRSALWSPQSKLCQYIVDVLMAKECERQSQLFVEKVEGLQSQINELTQETQQ